MKSARDMDFLLFHIFIKLHRRNKKNVECTYKKWRIWSTYGYLGFPPRRTGGFHFFEGFNSWALDDIIYNDYMNLIAFFEKDMTMYFDGFPLLFKED